MMTTEQNTTATAPQATAQAAATEETPAAGSELDALVAECVMGWTRYPEKMHPSDNRTIGGVLYCPPDYPFNMNSANVVPPYSTDIAAAWQVFEKLRERFEDVTLTSNPFNAGGLAYECSVEDPARGVGICWEVADTAPLAICLAALSAVKESQ